MCFNTGSQYHYKNKMAMQIWLQICLENVVENEKKFREQMEKWYKWLLKAEEHKLETSIKAV